MLQMTVESYAIACAIMTVAFMVWGSAYAKHPFGHQPEPAYRRVRAGR